MLAASLFKDDPELAARAIAYISCYMLGWSPIFWCLGYNIIARHDDLSVRDIIRQCGQNPCILSCILGVVLGKYTVRPSVRPSVRFTHL